MKRNTPEALVLPFGKHKGKTVAELLEVDREYAQWLAAQGWLAERFAELHAALAARGSASDETPEHNALQARFLDEVFRVAAVIAAYPTVALRRHPAWGSDLTRVSFEIRGIDVVVDGLQMTRDEYATSIQIGFELKPSLGDDSRQ